MNKVLQSNISVNGLRSASMTVKALALGVSAISLFATPAFAQEAQQRPPTAAQVQFNIPAQPLSSAVTAFGLQSGYQVSVDQATLAGLNSSGISGSFVPAEALSRLLSGSGVTWRMTQPRSVTLYKAPQSADGAIQLGPVRVEGEGSSTGVAASITSDPAATEKTGSYTQSQPTAIATKLGLTLRETPQSVSIVTQQRMADQALLTMSDALRQTPGIVIRPRGTERFNVLSRGYEINTYEIDGVPTYIDLTTHNVPQSQSDLAIYDRIEVLRGATGLMTGAGDPSGTINMVRKRPTLEFQGSINAQVGSWNQYRGQVDVSGPLTRNGDIRARVIGVYQQNDTYIDFYSQKKHLLYGVVEADITPTTTISGGASFQRDAPRGSPAGGVGWPLFFSNGEQNSPARSTNFNSRDNRVWNEALNIFSRIEQKIGEDWTLNGTFNYLENRQAGSVVGAATWLGVANAETGLGIPLYAERFEGHQKQYAFDVSLKGLFDLFGRAHEVVAGVNYLKYHNFIQNVSTQGTGLRVIGHEDGIYNLYDWDNRGVPDSTAPYTYIFNRAHKRLNFYGATRLHLTDSLSAIVGASINSFENSQTITNLVSGRVNPTLSKKNGYISPYAGLTYNINETHTIYASYTTIYSPQSQMDREGNYLDPREGINYELGWKSAFMDGRLNTAVALYMIQQDNLAVADTGYTVPGTTQSAYRPVKGAKTKGFDVEVVGELTPAWSVSASYTYSRTTDSQGDRITKVMPLHLAKIWTTYAFTGSLSGLKVGGGINWQSEGSMTVTPYWSSQTLEGRSGGYVIANLMARYEFNPNISLTLNANNIFDKTYISSLDDNFLAGRYGEPRNVLATLSVNF